MSIDNCIREIEVGQNSANNSDNFSREIEVGQNNVNKSFFYFKLTILTICTFQRQELKRRNIIKSRGYFSTRTAKTWPQMHLPTTISH